MNKFEQVLGVALVGLRAAVAGGADDQVLLNVESGIREIGLDPDRLHAAALQSPDDSAHGSADADLRADMIHRSPLARMRAALESFPGGPWSWEPHGDGWALYINRYAPIDPSLPSGFGNIQHGYNILTVDRGGFDSHAEALREFIIAASELASCPLVTIDRETLGMLVRDEWIKWAREQPNPKESWLVPWEGLSEPDKEVDRRIGERIVREVQRQKLHLAGKFCGDLSCQDERCIEAEYASMPQGGWYAAPKLGRYDLNILPTCLDLHMSITGAGDLLPDDERNKKIMWLRERLATWQPEDRHWARFEIAVKELLRATLAEVDGAAEENDAAPPMVRP